MNSPIQIRCLGGFDVELDGVPLRFSRSAPRKPLELLKGLLVLGGRPLAQQALCDALWPDADGYDAYRALITTVYRLRRLLQHREAVLFAGASVALNPQLCQVDAWTFENALGGARHPADRDAALLLYTGAFLGEEPHPHAFEARDRLQRRFVREVLALGREYEGGGRADAAIELYERSLDAGVLSEEIHRRLMEALARVGQRSAAVAIYQRCRTLLAAQLGVAPGSATERTLQAVARA